MRIDGKAISSEKLSELKNKVAQLKKKGITPTMAIILMEGNPASDIYVRQKGIKAKDIGAQVKVFPIKETTTNAYLEKLIRKLDKNPAIHGIIIQRPAPPEIKVDELTDLVSGEKEIDGFGSHPNYPVPVTAAVMVMLKNVFEQIKAKENFANWLKAKKIAVIGKGQTAGQPIIDQLTKMDIKLTVIDSHTQNKDKLIKEADIVISAVGKTILTSSGIKKGVILIGVGLYNNKEGKLKGDYDDLDVAGKASFYSPTPGGVGPINVACLLENLVKAATPKPY